MALRVDRQLLSVFSFSFAFRLFVFFFFVTPCFVVAVELCGGLFSVKTNQIRFSPHRYLAMFRVDSDFIFIGDKVIILQITPWRGRGRGGSIQKWPLRKNDIFWTSFPYHHLALFSFTNLPHLTPQKVTDLSSKEIRLIWCFS